MTKRIKKKLRKNRIITGWGWVTNRPRRKRLRKKLARRGGIRVLRAGPPDAKWMKQFDSKWAKQCNK